MPRKRPEPDNPEHVYDARRMLACGLAADVVLQSMKRHARLTESAAARVVKEARRQHKLHLSSVDLPTRVEVIEMHRSLYADAMEAKKYDTAAKVLRSLTDIVMSAPDVGGIEFDPAKPGDYLVALLKQQAAGRHIPAAVLAAAARAINAVPREEEEAKEDAKEEDVPKSAAEAAERALRIIAGGRRGK